MEVDGIVRAEPLPSGIVEFADATGPGVNDRIVAEPVLDISMKLADGVGLEFEDKIISEPVLIGVVEFANGVGREVEGNTDTEPLLSGIIEFEFGIGMEVGGRIDIESMPTCVVEFANDVGISVSVRVGTPTRESLPLLKVKLSELGTVGNAAVPSPEMDARVNDNVSEETIRLVIPVPAMKVELEPRDVVNWASPEVVPFNTAGVLVDAIIEFEREGENAVPEGVTVVPMPPVEFVVEKPPEVPLEKEPEDSAVNV